MPTIKPVDLNDCVRFITDHRQEIEQGVYDIEIQEDWVASITEMDLLFLAEHCPHAKMPIAFKTTRQSVLQLLARDPDSGIRSCVAVVTHASPDLLQALAQDKGIDVRLGVAGNQNTAHSTLRVLASDSIALVRQQVAENAKTPPDILDVFSKDADPEIRRFVARNRNTPSTALEVLSIDPAWSVSGLVPIFETNG